MNRKELLKVPKRKWGEELHNVSSVYIIPSRRKHESGYACMDFVAVIGDEKNENMVGFGGCCDVVYLNGEHFRFDCDFESKIIRIFNSVHTFTVTHDLSSIDFDEEK